jgi:catechol 2,3-dioxygenase-like lactoylglutathione lyase family enzyme
VSLFEELDFVYMPSRDVAADVRYFTDVLGARLTFAVEGMGTRVAMVELTEQPPRLLLAGHLEGDQPVLVYRVADIAKATHELESGGWQRGHMLEIPHGPVCTFLTPGGHRLAIYQLTRPEAGEHFVGRRDF